jgi:hypothetical protein
LQAPSAFTKKKKNEVPKDFKTPIFEDSEEDKSDNEKETM